MWPACACRSQEAEENVKHPVTYAGKATYTLTICLSPKITVYLAQQTAAARSPGVQTLP